VTAEKKKHSEIEKDSPQLAFDFFSQGQVEINEKKNKKNQEQSAVVQDDSSAVAHQEETLPDEYTEEISRKLIKKKEDSAFQPHNLRRAILGWLLTQSPTGLGVAVPTRISKYKADIAAFWALPFEKNTLKPGKTLIVELREKREDCWPDCSRNTELLLELKKAKQKKSDLQAQIRAEEPHLKDGQALFSEYESWNYHESGKKENHQ